MKKISTILLSAVILVASLGVTGVFADSLTPLPVLTDTSYSGLVSGGVQLNSGSWWTLYAGSFDYNTSDLYVGAVPSSDVSGYYKYYCASMASGQGVRYSNSASSATASTLNALDSSTGVYYSLLTHNPNLPTSDCPIFSSLSDFLSAVANPTTGEWIDFSIKPGYAFVIEGECEILERSYYINNSWNFFGTENSHRTNGSSERVSSIGNIRDGFSVDYGLNRVQLIQWVAQNPNLVGNASIYEFYDNDLVSLSSGSAFFISYPLYDGVQTTLDGLRSRENSVDFVGSIYINYSTRPTFRYVALKSNVDAGNEDVAFYNTLQPSITDSSGDVTQGSDSTIISPGDIPSGGGDSSAPPLDEDNSLLGTISKFVNDIKRLLSTAVESINTLVAEGSQFMRTVAQMFTWLPEQLTSLLIAAFTILVVVGVLKVLWR